MNLQELVKEEESEFNDGKVQEEEIEEDNFSHFIFKYNIPALKFSYNWIKAFLKRNKRSWRMHTSPDEAKLIPSTYIYTFFLLYIQMKWQEQ